MREVINIHDTITKMGERIRQRLQMTIVRLNQLNLKEIFIFLSLTGIFILAVYIWKHYFDFKLFGTYVLTPIYAFLIKYIVIASCWILTNIFSISLSCDIENSRLYFTPTSYLYIIKGCSGLREMSMFMFILIFFPGKWTSKHWFIPVSLILIYCISILRIVFLGMAYKYHPGWFAFLHEYLFNIVFFGLFFLLWLAWVKWFYRKKTVISETKLEPKEN